VPSVALVPACALIAGVAAGILVAQYLSYLAIALVFLWGASAAAWWAKRSVATLVCTTFGFLVGGVALGTSTAAAALSPAIRTLLDREIGGFALTSVGPPGPHEPFTIQARLEEDALPGARAFAQPVSGQRHSSDADSGRDVVTVRVQLEAIWIRDALHPVRGGLRLSIAGAAAREHSFDWRAGRRIQVPVTFRRPARYLNHGVGDFERDLALDGIALNASAKSGLLVDVIGRGTTVEERSARVRALVRARVARWIGSRDELAGGIVTAILIGDRTGLPDEVRARLQAAGTYHVIAISGGNIAILAALVAGVLLLIGVTGARGAGAIIVAVVAYAAVVNAGPSVWRATATAVAYLAARVIDHRTSPWNAMAVSAALLACAAPLDVRDAGFALTFGATAAIVEAASGVPRSPAAIPVIGRVRSWLVASVVASVAAEIVLLPIAASVFSRVTCAGVVLNLVAVPLMTVAQLAGLVVVAGGAVEWLATIAGAVAAWAAVLLVESARLIDVLPWLAIRVPRPSWFVVAVYYAGLAAAVWLRPSVADRSVRWSSGRRACAVITAACGILIVTGATPHVRSATADGRLLLTGFDVGQGDALLVQTPGGRTVMIDSGGAGFDGAAFDIGGRVLAPALWARGVRRLDILAITHGDPDHLGGAAALMRDFDPRELWEGILVPRHNASGALRRLAIDRGSATVQQLAGATVPLDEVSIRVLHPPAPDWERQRVRNDDSLVLELRHREVAILLTGDISAEVEGAIVPQLPAARTRILKVAHHGSRTSTGQKLLDAWKPQIAIVSCGRGNRFGHPAPDVMNRLDAAGVKVYRTDRDGEITFVSNGREVEVRRYIDASVPATPPP
jgi:competence protein ComEC